MNRAVRDKVMMLLFLISNSFRPFDHGLLSIYGCFRWFLESHLHRLISHRVVGYVVTSDTAPGPWLPNRSLLHQYEILQTSLYRFWFSDHCRVELMIVWILLRRKRLLVLMMIGRHDACTAKNYLATLRCRILFLRLALNLNLWPLISHFLARDTLITDTARVLVLDLLIFTLLRFAIILLSVLLWLFLV